MMLTKLSATEEEDVASLCLEGISKAKGQAISLLCKMNIDG